MLPNKCPECNDYAADISWDLEFDDWDVVAHFHCLNTNCQVQVFKSMFKCQQQAIYSRVGDDKDFFSEEERND